MLAVISFEQWGSGAPLLMAVAAVLLYVASRFAVEASTRLENPSPERFALGHWMPIAWVAVLAAGCGNSEIALGVIFGTSVAVLSLVLGLLTFLASSDIGPGRGARAWVFLVPLSLLTFLSGFRGSLTLMHAFMFAVMGVLIYGVWFARAPDGMAAPRTSQARVKWLPLLLAIAAAGVGAWLAQRSAIISASTVRIMTTGLIAATILSPLLALPILGTAAVAVQREGLSNVTSALVAIVMLNLSALLPAVIVIAYARNALVLIMTGTREFGPLWEQSIALPYPLATWRVDAVLILILGALLVPISLGRWTLARREGIILVILYAVYLMMSTALAIRL